MNKHCRCKLDNITVIGVLNSIILSTFRQSSLPVFSRTECVPVPESVSYLSSDGEEEEEKDKIDYPFISHHPRPAAVSTQRQNTTN